MRLIMSCYVLIFRLFSPFLAGILYIFSAPLYASELYKGQTIKVIIGMPPGGGVDAYGRLLQRHMPRYLPSVSGFVAQNMPGAGSLRAIQALHATPDDGTTIVTFSSTLLTDSILNPDQIKVDFRKFRFLGNISEDTRVCWVRKAFNKTSIQDMRGPREVIFGATTASQPEVSMIRNVMQLNMKIVTGYAGSADKRLAVEKGEIDGDCGGWTSIPALWRSDDGPVRIFLRMSPTLLTGMNRSIPYAGDLIEDQDMLKIFNFLTAPTRIGRPFLVKEMIPKDDLASLRKAFDQMVVDAEFVAEALKMELTVTPATGTDIDRQIEELYSTPTRLVEQARQIVIK
jgi:tripartite-type tricarboxylate transporter receptor subunit TctC